jgi:pimeloyl-ACP methyl ester carboxylesterase
VAYRRLQLDDGFVEYVVDGPEAAPDLLIFHVGTPAAAVLNGSLASAAAARGLRVATYSRGGYGSSPRRAGRSVADEAAITAALADRLGYERFFTAGLSGGGPVALAAAALLGDRIKACLVLASLAPRAEAGAAWEGWFTSAQLKEWDDLVTGDIAALVPEFEAAVPLFSRMTPRRLQSVGGPPDARAVAENHKDHFVPSLVRSMRRAVSRGYFGFLDDNLAQARDWGFRVADIRVPVVVRHGELDRLVAIGHGRWLADAIPGARGVFYPDAGHGSIALPWSEVIDDLLGAASG